MSRSGAVNGAAAEAAGTIEYLESLMVAGQRAQEVLDLMLSVRRRMTGLAEDFHTNAQAALERASLDLAEFDRQSQGALERSRKRVSEASRRLLTHRFEGGHAKPGGPDPDVRRLEQELKDAREDDARLLGQSLERRAPFESRYRAATCDVLLAGMAILASLEPDRGRLEAAVNAGQIASRRLGDVLARCASRGQS